MSETDKSITIQSFANEFGVTARTVRRWIGDKRYEKIFRDRIKRDGATRFIQRKAVDEFKSRRTELAELSGSEPQIPEALPGLPPRKPRRKKPPLPLISFANLDLTTIDDYCQWLKQTLKKEPADNRMRWDEVFCVPVYRSSLKETKCDEIFSRVKDLQQTLRSFLRRLIDTRSRLQDGEYRERLWQSLAWMDEYQPYRTISVRLAGRTERRLYPQTQDVRVNDPQKPWHLVFDTLEDFLTAIQPVKEKRADRRKEKLIWRVKICPECGGFFWDSTNNLSKIHCSSKCGSRVRKKRFKQKNGQLNDSIKT